MAALIPAAMLAGSVVSAVGASQAAHATETAALYNANQNTQNAQLAEEQARSDAARFGVQYRRQEGQMVAQFGASGLTAEGTESVLADSARNARLDEETIKYKGRIRALGFYNAATLDRLSAKTAVEQGKYKSASAFLTGVGHAGSTYSTSASRLRQAPAHSTSELDTLDMGYYE